MLNTGSFVFLSKKTSDTLVLLFFIVKNGDIAFRKWFMVSGKFSNFAFRASL